MDRKELCGLIKTLADSSGTSGGESKTAAMCAEIMRKYTGDTELKSGNVLAHFGRRTTEKPHVLIDAHLDTVGLIAVYITEDGFIKADTIGGLDMRLMPGQRVVIHGEKELKGVICTLPPHLKKDKTVMDKDSLYIDPVADREGVSRLVSPGDYISFDSPCTGLLNGRITGAGLDDRCGIASVIKAVDGLEGEYDNLPYTFTVMFSCQEELGERGAKTGTFETAPDISIAVDVSFALCGGENKGKCGVLGKGPMIGISPVLDRELSQWFISYALKKGIPFQREVMNGKTGTNADSMAATRCGSRAVTLSIPLRYMHTPAEVIDPGDCELTASLITAFLREGNIK